VLATRVGLAAIDGTALAAGAIRDVDVVRDDDAPRMNQVVRSRDGRYAFATESEAGSLAVASIGVASPLRPALSILAHVALDPDPDGLALSPDGNTIYVVSEVAGADAASIPGRHDRRLGRENCAINFGGNGVLTAIDVRAAISDPAHAVVARIAAGCAPSRVAVSPDGRVVWISVRGEARAIGFDAARLRNDSANAVVADVAVGERPIGIAVSSDGTRVVVVNSTPGGDDDSVRKATISVIDTAAALRGAPAVVATVPTGAFAREIVREPDGDYLVTNYNAKAIDVVRLSGSSNR
jgi:DNA-binding beta-propeller fold protein YncE